MAVRNFYVSGSVDGRKTDIGAGPASKDGGMTLTITQRDCGNIVTAFKIFIYVATDEKHKGMLRTVVEDGCGKIIASKYTER